MTSNKPIGACHHALIAESVLIRTGGGWYRAISARDSAAETDHFVGFHLPDGVADQEARVAELVPSVVSF